MALKPSAVPGTITTFSPFIWADRLLGHKVLNHTRKPRVSVTPVTKTGVLLGRSRRGTAPASLVPAGMLLRGPDMSIDMRLLADSEEAAGSEESEPVAMDLGCPLGCWELVRPATTAAYAGLPAVAALWCRGNRGAQWVGCWASSGRSGQAVRARRLGLPFPVVGCNPGGTLLAPVVVA